MIPSRASLREDFFHADSVDDGVDLASLEVFQVQFSVGVDDDGFPVELNGVRGPGRSIWRFFLGASGSHTQGDGRKRLLEKTTSLHRTDILHIKFESSLL